jgi:hypothetical protein
MKLRANVALSVKGRRDQRPLARTSMAGYLARGRGPTIAHLNERANLHGTYS